VSYIYKAVWPSSFNPYCKTYIRHRPSRRYTGVLSIAHWSSKSIKMPSLNYTCAGANDTVCVVDTQVSRWTDEWISSHNLSVSELTIRYNLLHKMYRELEFAFEGLDNTASVKEAAIAVEQKILARDMSSMNHDSDMANLMGLNTSGRVCSPFLFLSLFCLSFSCSPWYVLTTAKLTLLTDWQNFHISCCYLHRMCAPRAHHHCVSRLVEGEG
jgi:hypothetical protein